MENLYINGNLLIDTPNRVVFNSSTINAPRPKTDHKTLAVDKEGIYTITDNSFSNSVFLNVYVNGGITITSKESELRYMSISLYPELKTELDEINNKVLNVLKEDYVIHQLVLMGYFSQFELYLMEMIKLFILFDEKSLDLFIAYLEKQKDSHKKGKIRFLKSVPNINGSDSLFDKTIKIKEFISDMITYHRFDLYKQLFMQIFNISIPSFDEIENNYKKYRHDLAHRNGKNRGGFRSYIARPLVDEIYKELIDYAIKFDAIKNETLKLY